jgi:RHS repeat-associated protein
MVCAGYALAASPLDVGSIDKAPAASAPLLSAGDGVTAISGRVLATDATPLVGVTVIDGTVRATTDPDGRYLLEDVRAGSSVLVLDARQAGTRGGEAHDYGYYEVDVSASEGKTTRLPYVNWLTAIDHGHEVALDVPAAKDVVVRTPLVPGLELRIPAGAIFTDPDGKLVRRIGLTPISPRRPPFPLPINVNVPIYFTAQPGGSVISSADGRWLGAQVVYPNYWHQQPRARQTFWSYRPDNGGWAPYGAGTVTDDRTQVIPDPATRIYALTGAMQQGPQNPPPVPGPEAPKQAPPKPKGDPIDTASGSFAYRHTDLAIQDVLPISITRSYTSADTGLHSFGVGMSSAYDMNLYSSNEYVDAYLVLPNGSSVYYTRTAASIVNAPGVCPPFIYLDTSQLQGTQCYTDAIYTTTTPGPYFNSTITWNGDGWNLTKSDGTILIFGENAPLQAIQDRFGNRINLVRSVEQLGNIIQVNSPNGHYINFFYGNATTPTVVTSATDDLGRTFTYTYDTSTNTMLKTVTDPDGGVTTYNWQTSAPSYAQLQSIQDPRLKTFIQNTYGPDLRVSSQVLADQTSTYKFGYTVGTNCTTLNGINECNILKTAVTDPNSNIETISFDALNNTLVDTLASNLPKQAITTSYCVYGDGNLNPSKCQANALTGGPAGFMSDRVDALGRDTHYTYDADGNLLSSTLNYGTANAAAYQFTYSPTFNLRTSVKDPLNHVWTITRPEPLELPTAYQDPLGDTWTFTYNPDGQVRTVTDALTAPLGPNTYTFGYDHGHLASVTDPLSRTSTTFTDAAGRVLQAVDALGDIWQTVRDPIDGASQVTDPNGAKTNIKFDADGNVMSVTDALTHQTTYGYTDRDQLATRTDPDSNLDQYTLYDPNGNLKTYIDRKGQSRSLSYDPFNRIGAASYADGSAVSYSWDNVDRLTQVSDTAGNTISRFYDALDNLQCETPNAVSSLAACQGEAAATVSYTSDLASRRQTMNVSGQGQITYTFDNANRLTQISQATSGSSTSTVIKTYDADSRIQTVTYPNGVLATYAFDKASELTGITYTSGSATLGTLTYTYDNAGRIATRGGTLFQSVLPAAVAGAAYDPDNRLCAWNTATASCSSPTITWDANGNLLKDGVHTFGWDARNRLTSIVGGGNGGAYTYDALGRRLTNTHGGITITYTYDVFNDVLENQSNSITVNYLTGLNVDEVFSHVPVGGGAPAYYLTDALGSAVGLTGAAGTAVNTNYAYDPYGNTSASGAANSNVYQFAGRQNDGTSLYYNRARYYNPAWGRFISEDPIGFGGGINLYQYAGSSPVNFNDPGGYFATPLQVFGRAVLAALATDAAALTGGVAGALIPTTPAIDDCSTGLCGGPQSHAGGDSSGGNGSGGGATPPGGPANCPPPGPGGGGSGGGGGRDGGGGQSDDGSEEPNPGNMKRLTSRDMQRVAEDNGYDNFHDFKTNELQLDSRSDVVKDNQGNLYSVPRQGTGSPQSLGVSLP